MRFVLMIAGAAATGALSAGAIQTIFPQTAQMFTAVRALGGDTSNFKINLADLNPRRIYDDVIRKITSNEISSELKLPQGPAFKISGPINPQALYPKFKMDDRAMQRAIAAGMNSRINQDYRRAQDLAAYARNPMGWHGAPPH